MKQTQEIKNSLKLVRNTQLCLFGLLMVVGLFFIPSGIEGYKSLLSYLLGFVLGFMASSALMIGISSQLKLKIVDWIAEVDQENDERSQKTP